MSTPIAWKFENLPTVFITDSDKLEKTVSKMRQINNLPVSHQIQILNNGNTTTTEPIANDIPVSDIPVNTKKLRSLPKSAKNLETMEETPELFDVPNDVDNSGPESDHI